jgi:hypothetical protein
MASAAKSATPFSAKDRIDHHIFGTGTVLEANDKRTTIEFDDASTRKFVTSMVELTRSDTLAPEKPPPRKKRAKAKRAR